MKSDRLNFRLKLLKVLRYTRMYGPSRTMAKIRAQLHMGRRNFALPAKRVPTPHQTVALIGCGNYAYGVLAHFLTEKHGPVIAACMDMDILKAASLAKDYKVPVFTDNVNDIFALENIKLVYIASNHASHADYAICALRAGKHVYIEKPHVVNYEQLQDLQAAMLETGNKVFLGFNRPGSRFGRLVRQHLEAQSGSGMYNWFVAGHHIEADHWYFKEEEGGRILGNLCHWTDFLLHLPHDSIFPITIVPMRAKQPDYDIAVTYRFADGSICVITFSAKGATFEGVSERFNGHRGDCLVLLNDFKQLQVQVAEKKYTYTNLFRDHGHRDNVLNAYENVVSNQTYDMEATRWHVVNSALLFLKTKDALMSDSVLTVNASDEVNA